MYQLDFNIKEYLLKLKNSYTLHLIIQPYMYIINMYNYRNRVLKVSNNNMTFDYTNI